MDHDLDDLVTLTEVATLTGRHRQTVVRWVADGRLTPVKTLAGPKGAHLFSKAAVLRAMALDDPTFEPAMRAADEYRQPTT